ncbi:MAG: LON peptidase substrate-binding domain-containing protein [Planctomycetes bacterium]|nr:LON peptidase substrate-binding domain-containing protein [Planctomycetota bacterium]
MRRRPELLPVFPLPSVVLYPRVSLGLHIFEPRYRAMLSEVLDGHGRIAMANAVPGADPDDESAWTIATVVGVGAVASYNRRPDGTSDVFLVGESRARVDEWVDGKPFRRVRVTLLADASPRSQVARDRLKAELEGHLKTILLRRGPRDQAEQLLRRLAREREVGFLADFVAHHFLRDLREKQALLEELDVERRVERLREMLATRGLI